jgi:ureidoacrylate peracid hydrolase
LIGDLMHHSSYEEQWTFEHLVDPQHTAVLAIDVQKDFCDEDGAMARLGKDLGMVKNMLPYLMRFLTAARNRNLMVIITKRINSKLSDSPVHRRQLTRGGQLDVAVEGTTGVEFSKGFEPKDNDYLLFKHRYSAFTGTELDLILRSNGIRTIVVAGVATNACVEATARDGFMHDYHVVLVSDCCATYDPIDLHKASLRNAEVQFATVTTSEQVLRAWQT